MLCNCGVIAIFNRGGRANTGSLRGAGVGSTIGVCAGVGDGATGCV